MSKGESKITFEGFQRLESRIKSLPKEAEKAVRETLTEAADIVENNTRKAAYKYAGRNSSPRHYSTGAMYSAIISKPEIQRNGNYLSVHTGFDFNKHGGHHSIWVTGGNGNGYTGDKELKDALKGSKTRKEIQEKEAEIMDKYLGIGG